MIFPRGFFIIDKPSGVTSFSMVSLVRRLTGVRRVGHAGTLDPLASGVLPVAVGQASRLIEYLDDATKTYVAQMRFGVETDTYDAEGEVIETRDASGVTAGAVEAALHRFEGEIEQVPPAFSAIKVAGKPLYRYARAGQAVEVRPRTVRVDSIRLIRFGSSLADVSERGAERFGAGTASSGGRTFGGAEAPRVLASGFDSIIAEIEVVCSKGTYIRSIAHGLGRMLGCGGHLVALRRTRSGGFGIELACSPEALTSLAEEGRLEEALLAPDRAVERRGAAIVGEEHAADVLAGRDLELLPRAPIRTGESCRAYDTDGRFLGVLTARAAGVWHPAKVLAQG